MIRSVVARLGAIALLPTLLATCPRVAAAEEAAASGPAAPAPTGGLTHGAFLAELAQHNLELAAQRFNVSIAEAQIAVAKVFPDPSLTVGVSSVDVAGQGSPTVSTVGLGVTVELGGKRSARTAAAVSDHHGAENALSAFFGNLRATATGDFIDALKARLVLDRKRQTEKSLDRLVSINRERVRAGDIGQVALTQSRVEAARFRGEVIAAEADVTATGMALALDLNRPADPQHAVTPLGDLRLRPRTFPVEALVAEARLRRPDVMSKHRAAESAAARVDVAKANRWVDVTLNASLQHAFPGHGAFQSPAYDALGATVTVPLPFSKAYRGELNAALSSLSQSRVNVEAAEHRAESEVRQAVVRYDAAVKRMALFTEGLLSDADRVLEATLYNYQRGGATLLEVLEAQRTQNEVFLGYLDALSDHARSLVAVELAAGIWDLTL